VYKRQGVAQAQDGFTAALNPAGIAFLSQDTLDLGFTIFSPRRKYSANALPPAQITFAVAPGTHDSDSNWLFVPNFAFAKRINDKFSTGISFYANGGMNTNYGDDFGGSGMAPAGSTGAFGGGRAGGDLKQMFINVPVAFKPTPNFSLGASFLTLIETVKLHGLGRFTPFSIDPNNFSNRFTSVGFGFGGLFGAVYKVNDIVSLGASYQTKITPSQLSAYRGLFPNGRIEVPAKTKAGVSVKPTAQTVVNLDYEFIDYEGTKAFGNPNVCTSMTPCFGPGNGSGFGFKNTNAIKLGGQWQYNEDWIFRAGYGYNNNPIQSSQVLLNIIAPAVTEHHLTLGFTRKINESNKINASFLYAPNSSISGPNQFNPAQTITLSMHQYEFGLSWTWILDKEIEVTK